ncbi:peptidase S8/S53 domain-containing protein [Cadophora sp. MPI-SDFR-AT-0126]|nr:peptidase S8/S53 domain-containing protein [Leotiomycetes sp. MPI-SDFR-AT-0126]
MKQKATLASIGPEGWTAADARNGLHGTAMLTFLAGGSYGVAREAVPYGVTFAAEDGHQWVINALDDIERDWKATKAAGLLADICVLSMSFGYLPDFGGTAFNKHFADRLKALDSLDMLSIVAAGNDGEAIKTVPQIFADSNTPNNNHVNTMLVVGAVDSTGIKWQYSSTASFVTLYAPGVDCTWKSKDPATGAIKRQLK